MERQGVLYERYVEIDFRRDRERGRQRERYSDREEEKEVQNTIEIWNQTSAINRLQYIFVNRGICLFHVPLNVGTSEDPGYPNQMASLNFFAHTWSKIGNLIFLSHLFFIDRTWKFCIV